MCILLFLRLQSKQSHRLDEVNWCCLLNHFTFFLMKKKLLFFIFVLSSTQNYRKKFSTRKKETNAHIQNYRWFILTLNKMEKFKWNKHSCGIIKNRKIKAMDEFHECFVHHKRTKVQQNIPMLQITRVSFNDFTFISFVSSKHFVLHLKIC